MTSTNIFQGKADSRNSSRVLRPPGGGHTDVLGLGAPQEAPQTKKISPRNVSSIVEGTNTTVPPVAPPVEAPRSAPEAPKVPSSAQEAPQKVRVPPGGFSSGLW